VAPAGCRLDLGRDRDRHGRHATVGDAVGGSPAGSARARLLACCRWPSPRQRAVAGSARDAGSMIISALVYGVLLAIVVSIFNES
jgi:hypothetical protein